MRKKIFAILSCILMFGAATTALAQSPQANALLPAQRAIAPIAAFTANGDQEQLKSAIVKGLDAGLTVNEIKEVMVQLYAYAGFPRALNALNTFMALLDERAKSGITDTPGREATSVAVDKNMYERGRQVQATLRGGSAVTGGVMDFAPAIDRYLNEHLFGAIFASDILDFQAREIATVSALSTIKGAEAQLRSHLRNSMHVGLTEAQLRELSKVIEAEVGKDEGDSTLKQLNSVLATN